MLEPSSQRATRTFSADEVFRMVETGVLREDEPIELVEGDLLVVSPQGSIRSSLTARIHRMLERLLGEGFHVRDHSPVRADPNSLPEPDLAVVRGEPDDFLDRLPGPEDVVLVVEISVSTRAVDRRKARVYSAAGYGTYWTVDVDARRLEVRTAPVSGGEYAETRLLDENAETSVPEAKASLSVRALLP